MKEVLRDAVVLIVDAVKDTLAANATSFTVASLLSYKNLVGDLIALAPDLKSLPEAFKSLSAEDRAEFYKELEAGFGLPEGKTSAIVHEVIQLISLADPLIVTILAIKNNLTGK